jgi:hypothetical protein
VLQLHGRWHLSLLHSLHGEEQPRLRWTPAQDSVVKSIGADLLSRELVYSFAAMCAAPRELAQLREARSPFQPATSALAPTTAASAKLETPQLAKAVSATSATWRCATTPAATPSSPQLN